MDRIDLRIEVPAVTAADLILPPSAEGSAEVAARIAAARDIQRSRYAAAGLPHIRTKAGTTALRPRRDRATRSPGHQAVARCCRNHAPFGAWLSPRAARRPHP